MTNGVHRTVDVSAMDQVLGIMLVIVVIGLLVDKIFFSPIRAQAQGGRGVVQDQGCYSDTP